PPALWHGHEMLFGYVAAVVAGFLLTSVPAWSGAAPLQGWPLAALAALWLAGRLAMALPLGLPAWVIALVDCAFLPTVATWVGMALWRARKLKNMVFVAVLMGLAIVNLLSHWDQLQPGSQLGYPALLMAVDGVALLIVILGGRITPAFTANALRMQGVQATLRTYPWLERAAVGSVAALVAAQAAQLAWPGLAGLGAALALLAAALNGLRLAGYQSRRTTHQPILWVLHVGYGWLVVGLALQGLAPFWPALPPTTALHALTIGAMGTYPLGVMSRAALGHTGRPLVAPRLMAWAYGLISLAALLRLAAPLLWPEHYPWVIGASGVAWTLAFALFLGVYAPILLRPRVDGQPG
ncbi:MAG TPA: NnrS family protein, partial [bacterium]|nr:NnrS family protein [bacterium]